MKKIYLILLASILLSSCCANTGEGTGSHGTDIVTANNGNSSGGGTPIEKDGGNSEGGGSGGLSGVTYRGSGMGLPFSGNGSIGGF